MEPAKPRRWFSFRYSLRTLFVVMTVVCLVSGFWLNKAFRQREAVRRFNQMTMEGYYYWGPRVVYRNAESAEALEAQIPAWGYPLRLALGKEAFGEVIEVDLTATTLTDDDLQYLADLPTVERLSLSNTKVTDKGLRYLRSCPKLKFLALNSVPITDDGLEQIAALTELEALGLVGTKVTDEGLRHLMKLPKLKILSLQSTEVSDNGYQEFQAALPQCSVMASVPAFYEKHRDYFKDRQSAD